MLLKHFLFALLFTLVFAVILGLGLRRRKWGIDIWFFSLVLFLFTWAGGVWLSPIGPYAWGVPISSFFLVGLLVALLLAPIFPSPRETMPSPTGPSGGGGVSSGEKSKALVIDAFTWLVIAGLILAIVLAYV
jgi:hypothetical protein